VGGGEFAAALELPAAAANGGAGAGGRGRAAQQQQQQQHPFLAQLRGGAPVTTAALAAQAPASLRVPLPGALHSLHVLRGGGGGGGGGEAAVVAAVLRSGAVGCADFRQGELEQAEAAEGAPLAAASAGAGLAVAVRVGAAAGGVAVALYAATQGGGGGALTSSPPSFSASLRRVPIAHEQDGAGTEGESTDAEDEDDEAQEAGGGGDGSGGDGNGGTGGGGGRRQQQHSARRRRRASAATAATPLGLLHLPAPRGGRRALCGLAYWPGAYVAALWEGGAVTMRSVSTGGSGGGDGGGGGGAGVAPVTAGPPAELLPGPFFGDSALAAAASPDSRKRSKPASSSAGAGAGAYALAALGPRHLLLVRVGRGGVGGGAAASPLSARHAVIDARYGVALASGSAELSGVPPNLDLGGGSGGVQLLPLGSEANGGGSAAAAASALSGNGRGRTAALVLGGQAAFVLSIDVPAATLASMVGRMALAGGVGGGQAGGGAQGGQAVVVATALGGRASAPVAASGLITARARPLDVAALLTAEQRLAAAQDAAPCALRPAAAIAGALSAGDEAAAASSAAAAEAAAAAAAEDLMRAVEAFEASCLPAPEQAKKPQHQRHDEAAADAVEAAALRAAKALSSASAGAGATAAEAASPVAAPAAARGRRSPAKAAAAASSGAGAASAALLLSPEWRMSPRLLGRAAAALAAARRWPALGRLLSAQPPQTLLHCPRLLPALAAARQYDLVALVCASAEDVPAGSVVRAMCSVLATAAAARAAKSSGGKGGAAAAPTPTPTPQPQQAAWRARVRACAERAVAQAEARPADPGLRAAAWRAAAAVDRFSAEEVALHALAAAPADPVELTAALRRRLPSARAALRLVRYLGKWAARHGRLPIAGPDAARQFGGVHDPAGLGGGRAGGQASGAGFPAEADESGGAGGVRDDGDGFGAAGPLPARVLLLSPGYAQVLDLMRAVLDAQLTPLALLGQSAAPALEALRRTVGGAAAAGASLARLKGAAEHLAAGAPLPDAAIAAASNYTVELLDLRVAPAAAGGGGGERRGGGGQQQQHHRRSGGGGGKPTRA